MSLHPESILNGISNYFPSRAPGDGQQENLKAEAIIEASEVDAEGNSFQSKKHNLLRVSRNFDYNPIDTKIAVATGHCKLDFKPLPIRSKCLLLTIFLSFTCIIGIILIIRHGTPYGFHIGQSNAYIACRYVPVAIGLITTHWWHSMIAAFARMIPYINAAEPEAGGNKDRRLGRTLINKYADHAFAGDISSMAANGDWLLCITIIVQELAFIIIVPLKASFLQILVDTSADSGWRVTVYPAIRHALIAIYVILILLTALMLTSLLGCDTGVKWAPVSIADQLALVQRSNLLDMYDGLEFATQYKCAEELRGRGPRFGTLRLGYWKHRSDGSIWHGLACVPRATETAQTPPASNVISKVLDYIFGGNQEQLKPDQQDPETPLDYDGNPVTSPESFRYRDTLWFLQDLPLVLIASVPVLVIALTITGLAKHRIQNGYNHHAFSTFTIDENFIGLDYFQEGFRYRFLPVLMMYAFNYIWSGADRYYRATEPYAGMNEAAPATRNLLLDYSSTLPVSITLKAFRNGHWRLAICSALSLASAAPPVVANGIFTVTPSETQLVVSIQKVSFWASFCIIIFYVFCLIVIRPPPKYRLPRRIISINEVFSYCYQSRLLDDMGVDGKPVFSTQDIGEGREHLEARIHLAKKEYQFGLYLGKDGRRHMGFDVASRDDGNLRVTKFYGGRGFRNDWPKCTFFFKEPRVEKTSV